MVSGICWGEEEVVRSTGTNGSVFIIVVDGWWVQEVHYTVSFYFCVYLKVPIIIKTKKKEKSKTLKPTEKQKAKQLRYRIVKPTLLPSSNFTPGGASKTIDSCWCCQNGMWFRFPSPQVGNLSVIQHHRESNKLYFLSSQQCGTLQQGRSHTLHL